MMKIVLALVLLAASTRVGALPTVPVSTENDPSNEETSYEVDLYETDQVEFDQGIVNDRFFGSLFDAPVELKPELPAQFMSDDEGSKFMSDFVNYPNSADDYTVFPRCELCAPELGMDTKKLCESNLPLTEDCQIDFAEGDMAGVGGSKVAEFVENLNRRKSTPPCDAKDDPNCRMSAAIRDPYSKWANGVVPYGFTSDIPPANRRKIRKALDEIEDLTCIKFVPKKQHDYWLKIGALGGCWSFVGRRPKALQPQDISLDAGCMQKGRIQHEILHALGFYHEQSRYDRDDFIKVLYNNIRPGKEHNFEKHSPLVITHLGSGYDYGSVMHYNAYSFSDNRRETIVPYRHGKYIDANIGQRDGVSKTDILEINRYYNCPLDENDNLKKTAKRKMKTRQKRGEACEDLSDWCSIWSAKHGYCDKFSFMEKYCRLSCKLCKPNDS